MNKVLKTATALETLLFLLIFLVPPVSAIPPSYVVEPDFGYVGESLELSIGIYDDVTPDLQSNSVTLSFEPEGITVYSIEVMNSDELKADITIEDWATPGCYNIFLYVGDFRVPLEEVYNCFEVKHTEFWVQGKVTDNETKKGVPGVEVSVEMIGTDNTTTTSPDGTYALEVPSGMIKVVTTSDDYYQTSWTGHSKPGRIYIDFPLNPPNGSAASSSTFSGEIKDATTGEPIEGDDWLFFLFPNGFVEDVGEGEFKEEGLTPGLYLVFLFKWGYWPWINLLELVGGEIEMFTIELIPM